LRAELRARERAREAEVRDDRWGRAVSEREGERATRVGAAAARLQCWAARANAGVGA
jgi:hypothetical protein